MTVLNGVSDAFNPEHLLSDIAERAFAAVADDGETWADLPEDEREGVLVLVEAAVHAFTAALKDHGVRLLPPGVTAAPKSDEEAAAMLLAVQQFRAAQKRKGRLITGAAGLVVPTHIKTPRGRH